MSYKTNFQKITESPEALGAFLGSLPVLSGPWDDAFHDHFCAGCEAENCDAENCHHPAERDNPLWWLGLPAEPSEEAAPRAGGLTEAEISTLVCYILMTTKHREREAEAWEKLAQERNDDGSIKFIHAADNARYYRDLEKELTAIRGKLEASA